MRFATYILAACTIFFANTVAANNVEVNGLTISKVRAVGNYHGETFDNTLEVWFAAPMVFPTNMPCNATGRVAIDKADQHLISAAYMAFTSGKKINVYLDGSLPIRGGMCQVSFIDVVY